MEAMSTWAARYVRLGRARIARGTSPGCWSASIAMRGCTTTASRAFAVWLVPSPTFQPTDLAALSKDFGEAIAIAVQTVADLVIYDHFVAGARVRGLTYAGEAGWIRVAGEPEPWEAQGALLAAKLAELSEELEEDLEDDAACAREGRARAPLEAGKLVEGSSRPPARSGRFHARHREALRPARTADEPARQRDDASSLKSAPVQASEPPRPPRKTRAEAVERR